MAQMTKEELDDMINKSVEAKVKERELLKMFVKKQKKIFKN